VYALYTIRVCDVHAHYTILYIIIAVVYEGGANLVPVVVAAATPPPRDYTRPLSERCDLPERRARGGAIRPEKRNVINIHTTTITGVPVCVVTVIYKRRL